VATSSTVGAIPIPSSQSKIIARATTAPGLVNNVKGAKMAKPKAAGARNTPARARRLLDIVNGSWMSQATYVAAYLGIPDLLADGARSGEGLARATNAHAPSLRRLMRALVTIGICRDQGDGIYQLTTMGSLLRSDTADSLRAWTLYWGGSLWPIWGNLLHSVMTGKSARTLTTESDRFEQLDANPEAAKVFNQAMVELTRLDSVSVARACNFSGMKRIVDVGGGYGELLGVILQANPDLHGVLFDRKHAIEEARLHMQAASVADRCEFVVGDFFESIPVEADAYILKSVIHDWNDQKSMAILHNCRRAMHDRARILLVERIVPRQLTMSAAHRAIARGDLNMLTVMGGQERTEEEYRRLLEAAELSVKGVVPAGPVFSVIEAAR